MRTAIFCTLLLALAFTGCDRGPTPSGNAGNTGNTEEGNAENNGTEGNENGPPEGPVVGPINPHPVHAGEGVRRPAPSHGEMEAPAVVSEETPSLAGVAWDVHAPFQWRRPSRPMRNGEYAVGSGDTEAVLTVFHFPGMGGSVEDNLQRWARQFRQPDGAPAEANTENHTIGGLEVSTIDTQGTFTSAMPMGGNRGPQLDQRMLGAIVAGPQGPVFFKLLGPADTVGSAEGAFQEMVQSFRPQG